MQYSAVLLLELAATTATANLQPLAIVAPKRALQARQSQTTDTSTADGDDDGSDDDDGFGDDDGSDDDDSDTCDSAFEALTTDMPEIPDDVYDYAATYTATGCMSLPTSILSDYEDYTSSLDDWYATSSDDISSFLDYCTDYSLDLSGDVCTDAAEASTGVASAKATATTTSDGSESDNGKSTATAKDSSSSSKTGASAKVTATAGAAVRDVGIVGAVLAGALGAAMVL